MTAWLKRASRTEGKGTLLVQRFVVLDTELTSLDHRTNRLLSIGAIAMRGTSIPLGEQFYRVVNPRVSIPQETVVIHKLRMQDVQVANPFEETLDDFCNFIDTAVLVGHFVNIELKILNKEMATTGRKLENVAIDTAQVHQWILRHGSYSEDLSMKLEQLDLPTVARFYSVEVDNLHHALADAFLTARIWQKMLYALEARGVDTLPKVLRIAGV